MRNPFSNPLFIKELREEVRSKRIFVQAPVFIAILSAVAMVGIGTSGGISFNPATLAGTARYTMYAFVVTMTLLIGLIATIFGSSSFTTEREKATYELLELTPLSLTDLVLGKFLHAFVIVSLILLSSTPVIATLFFMGGLTYVDVFLTLFYLLLFFAVAILGSILISVASSRTLFSIILSLLLGFILSVGLSILTADAFADNSKLGFATISPWVVTWQQIFAPAPLKILGYELPIWPFYLILYLLLGSLLLAWARNALDSRKLERNWYARVLGFIFINFYVAVGTLSVRSHIGPISMDWLENFYQAIMAAVVVALPFFAMGTFTDKDQLRYRRKPLLESFRPRRLLLNDPSTGPFYLMALLVSVAINIMLCTAAPWKPVASYLGLMAIWIFPWTLVFTALRIKGASSRMIFIVYLLATLLYSLLSAFQDTSHTAGNLFVYLISPYLVAGFCVICVGYYVVVRIQQRVRTAGA